VNQKTLAPKVEVTSDAEGLTSHSGAYLLAEMADHLGLTEALSKAMAPTRSRRSVHDPGRVIRDLAVSVADGGDCVSDLGVLAGQRDLFGNVASNSTAHRVISSIGQSELEGLRSARAKARAYAWKAGTKPEELIIDIDATLLQAHSEKDQAAGNYKGGFGFHPLMAYLSKTGEPLAGLLRPGNAGANTAADHSSVLELALEQIPEIGPNQKILIRTDAGGATRAFTSDCRQARAGFSVGYELSPAVQEVLLRSSEVEWQPAIDAEGEIRAGAWVTELTGEVDLSSWPEGSRLICRRERAHPGAQFKFTDLDGHRFTCFLTDTEGDQIAELELRHRRRARVEDFIRCGKDTGMRNLPFADFTANKAWLEISLIAQDLLAFAKVLCLTGALARAEPKRLRQRLFHVAGRICRSGRRTTLRLPRSWPWAAALEAAFARLRALPAPLLA
jgi:hypothetical protein